jgi:para-aminobenzoate synthetase component 1
LRVAVDAFTLIKTDSQNAFESLKQYQQNHKRLGFGYLSYDLKTSSLCNPATLMV